MKEEENHIVIMAGGIGSRFWPMSTPAYPKQFIDVMGVGKSLLQLTVDRFLSLCPIQNFWIVTSTKYVDIIKEQLPELPASNILAEPEARNTAPCIGYACWKIQKLHPNANIVVSPSDALVLDTSKFHKIMEQALNFTKDNQAIVTVGIKPNRPETGYGYICTESLGSREELVKVSEFKEKPNLKDALKYVEAGNYYWNSGIFIWNMETIITAFRTFVPELSILLDKMSNDFYTEKEEITVKRLFPLCEKVSIDYAVMEKAKDIYTIPTDFGWSDLGSWGSLHTLLTQDSSMNAVVGNNIKLYNCSNCIVHAIDERKVILEGLDGYIVAEKNGQLLICRLSEEQKIKEFAAN